MSHQFTLISSKRFPFIPHLPAHIEFIEQLAGRLEIFLRPGLVPPGLEKVTIGPGGTGPLQAASDVNQRFNTRLKKFLGRFGIG